jgi:hypothetical protein
MERPRNEGEEIIGERLRRIESELTQNAGEGKKKKADLQYLTDLRDDLRAYLNLTVGQAVTDGKRLGVIAQLSLPSVGLPVVWVSWYASVPVPERPNRLKDEPFLCDLKVGDTVAINGNHPEAAGKTFEVREFKGNGWILTTDNRLFHCEFFLSCDRIPESHLTKSDQEDPAPESLAIALIRTDGGTQPRATIDRLTVAEYAKDMRSGDLFPPVLVFYDGSDYWLADGFHRLLAAQSLELPAIAVDIRRGTRRDAILYSVGANAHHGLRRSHTDKRRAVLMLLQDGEWSRYSNNHIAKLCFVSADLVNRLRLSLNDSLSERQRIYQTKHGTISTMDTTNIGRHRKSLSEISPEDGKLTENSLSEDGSVKSTRLTVGSFVTVVGEHPRKGQTGEITALPNPYAAIILFDDGNREMLVSDFLSPKTIDVSAKFQVREGLNYRAGNGCEWYVRLEQATWERLLRYRNRIGTATIDGAIKRMLESIENCPL